MLLNGSCCCRRCCWCMRKFLDLTSVRSDCLRVLSGRSPSLGDMTRYTHLRTQYTRQIGRHARHTRRIGGYAHRYSFPCSVALFAVKAPRKPVKFWALPRYLRTESSAVENEHLSALLHTSTFSRAWVVCWASILLRIVTEQQTHPRSPCYSSSSTSSRPCFRQGRSLRPWRQVRAVKYNCRAARCSGRLVPATPEGVVPSLGNR